MCSRNITPVYSVSLLTTGHTTVMTKYASGRIAFDADTLWKIRRSSTAHGIAGVGVPRVDGEHEDN